MKVYSGENIRNVAIVGHGHAGKTSLVSAMLYTAGATPRLGRVDDGSATTDFEEEEIARKMSISMAAASVEWGKTKINILDTPGFSMFVHEAKMVLPVVDAAIVVVDGVAGDSVHRRRRRRGRRDPVQEELCDLPHAGGGKKQDRPKSRGCRRPQGGKRPRLRLFRRQ